MPPLGQTDQIFIGLILGVIISVIIGGIRAIYRRYRPPARVSPRIVEIQKTAPDNALSFLVENKTADMLFNVAVKLNLENLSVSAEGVDISPDYQRRLNKEEISNLMDDYDFVRIDGTDSNGKESILFILRRLVPQTPTTFLIRVPQGGTNQDNASPRILLRTLHQSKTPDEQEYPFNPPKFNARGDPRLIKREAGKSPLQEPAELS
jgi:hypothetical protein